MADSKKTPILQFKIKGMFQTFRIVFIVIVFLTGIPTGLSAQQIRVDDFTRLKKPFLGTKNYETDKQSALLDLYTQESRFEFLIGKQPIEAKEGDGFLTLALPDKTTFFTIKHPEYGQFTWKTPEELRRKKHYQAYLFTDSPDKEYQLEKQWAVFYIQPEQAIVTIDSTVYRTMDGTIQAYLPIGKHTFKAESPFYETLEDSITIDESSRWERQIYLQPLYAFLMVNSHMPLAEIRLDGQLIGIQEAQSKRLLPGTYQLTVQKDSLLLYQETVLLTASEKRVIDLKKGYDNKRVSGKKDGTVAEEMTIPAFQPVVIQPSEPRPDSLHVRAFDEDTEIWINRELVAKGSWKEELPPGIHAISTRKEGIESPTQFIQAGTGNAQRLKMPTPYAKYGWLNVSSNVVDADVWLDGELIGKTPCILPPLSTYKKYTIRLSKEGYKEMKATVSLKDNDIQNLYLKLKKK